MDPHLTAAGGQAWEANCPTCYQPVDVADRFCEWCGRRILHGARPAEGAGAGNGGDSSRRLLAQLRSSVDVSVELGGCSDVGAAQAVNADALALAELEQPTGRVCGAVLVVCDGLADRPEAGLAAHAAAEAARSAVCTGSDPSTALSAATEAADVPLSLAVATLIPREHDAVITMASLGDSRVYWLPDAVRQQPRQLDTPGFEDGLTVTSAGWLVCCSDGLSRYHGAPHELRSQIHLILDEMLDSTRPDLVGADTVVRAAQIAQGLVASANRQGGEDSITVALARWDPPQEGW